MKHIKVITDEQLLEQISGGATRAQLIQDRCPIRQVVSRLEKSFPGLGKLFSFLGGGVKAQKAAM